MNNQLSTQPGEPRSRGLRKVRGYLFGLALLAGLVAAGCSQGSYPLDIFYEMHYQQSFKADEPPRLSPPESSVPWYPAPISTSFNTGQHMYVVNCAMCHGLDAKGTASPDGPGPVLKTMMDPDKYGYEEQAPTDLTLFPPDFIQQVVGFTALPNQPRFFGKDSVMPPFGKLMTSDEIRDIAQYIATLAPTPAGTSGQGEPPAAAPTPTPASAPASGPGPLVIGVNGDALTFDTETIEVASGSEVALTFNNGSGINQHNWVVVQAGTKDAVSQRGTTAGQDNDWVEPGDADVVAYTKVLNPGATGEVRFAAPPAGAYQFVCTFPGHNFTMFGDFVVTP